MELTRGFSTSEMNRLADCLDRLAPHARLEHLAITGGVGIQLGLAWLGRQGSRDEIADLDLVADSIDAIRPSVAFQFLVSHYHVMRPRVPKFMIQLVDPLSRIRIDMFPDLAGSLGDTRTVGIGGQSIKVLSLGGIFEHKVQTLSRASSSAPIDPKHVRDAVVLGEVLGRVVPLAAAGALARDVYGGDADLACERCELSSHPDWPLAPKDRIFELLGWAQQPIIGLQPTAAGGIMSRRG